MPPSTGWLPLRLYTRRGCCLCEGLEERLLALEPPPVLECVDVDGDDALQARYGLRVPVLAVPASAEADSPAAPADPSEAMRWSDLPPVPPRLAGERLMQWLGSHGAVAGASAAGTPSRGTGP